MCLLCLGIFRDCVSWLVYGVASAGGAALLDYFTLLCPALLWQTCRLGMQATSVRQFADALIFEGYEDLGFMVGHVKALRWGLEGWRAYRRDVANLVLLMATGSVNLERMRDMRKL